MHIEWPDALDVHTSRWQNAAPARAVSRCSVAALPGFESRLTPRALVTKLGASGTLGSLDCGYRFVDPKEARSHVRYDDPMRMLDEHEPLRLIPSRPGCTVLVIADQPC